MQRRFAALGAATMMVFASPVVLAAPVGYWRMDEGGASDGGAIGTVVNVANPGTIDGAASGGALYSSDVPAPYVFDPVAGTYTANGFSLDAGGANRRINVANNPALDIDVAGNRSFTIEFFLRMTGEPAGYENFLARVITGPNPDNTTSSDRQGWQVDIDHGTGKTSYGKVRSRWDTPGTAPDPYDLNRVTTGGYIFVDTDTGSGNPNDYDATDVFNDGDGVNDIPTWRHVALTYNDTNKKFQIYLDGIGGNIQTLVGQYDHPQTSLLFGKFSAGTYGLLIDEVRYSSGVLAPNQFLTATTVPEPATAGLVAVGLLAMAARRRRRPAID